MDLYLEVSIRGCNEERERLAKQWSWMVLVEVTLGYLDLQRLSLGLMGAPVLLVVTLTSSMTVLLLYRLPRHLLYVGVLWMLLQAMTSGVWVVLFLYFPRLTAPVELTWRRRVSRAFARRLESVVTMEEARLRMRPQVKVKESLDRLDFLILSSQGFEFR